VQDLAKECLNWMLFLPSKPTANTFRMERPQKQRQRDSRLFDMPFLVAVLAGV
jgi:hypothetical protein